MAMDINGRNPSHAAGEYFRANIWAWEPMHNLIGTLCGDFLAPELIGAMVLNDGWGPLDQATCTRMADCFEEWLQSHHAGHTLQADIRVDSEGRRVSADEDNPAMDTYPLYQVSDEQLREWVQFLRHCGGFHIW
jgi:hypothetical protein